MRTKERLLRIAGRVGSWRSPMALGAYALSLVAYAIIVVDRGAVSQFFSAAVGVYVYGLGVVVLAACAAGAVVVKRDRTYRSLLGLYTSVTAFLLLAFRLRLETDFLLVLTNVLWAFLFEPFPVCLGLGSGVALLLSASLLLAPGRGLLSAAAVGLAAVMLAVLGSLLIRAHEKTIELQKYADRLEQNVASLARANILSQDYAKDIEMESRVRERDRLTRDIHDTIGYTLTNTVMMVEAIKVMARAEPERVPHHVKRIRAEVEEGLAHIRQTLREFRASEHGEESVYWAVKKLVKVFTISTGLKVRYEMGNADISDLERFPDAVYHFIQEGLINAFRHGHASRVMIWLWDYGDWLRILLDDDGMGCPDEVTPGIGIAGMGERAALAGGRIAVDPAETGFRISMYLPTGREHGKQDQAADRG